MGEVELVNAIRNVSVDAVNVRSKPTSVIIGTYLGNKRVNIGDISVDVIIPRSILPCCNPTQESCVCQKACCIYKDKACPCPKRIKTGDSVLVIKQDGTNSYFVIAKI